ncbi:MAG: TRAP transporter small permease [Fusobacteriaceae bacterium]|jgi:TRAP-type C4-dicarboxylate transport system permease small subunit|nr:TRAP transporter small permease [Fusobacteriaceae bacterium]
MKKLLIWFDKYAEASVMGLLIFLMTIFMAIQIVLRYCFGNSLIWVEEVIVYFNVWIGFIGISYCVRYKCDMKIDASGIFPSTIAKYFRYISSIVLFIVYLYMGYIGIGVVKTLMRTGQRSPAAGIPMYFVYGSLMIGCLLSSFRFIQRFYLFIRSKKEG